MSNKFKKAKAEMQDKRKNVAKQIGIFVEAEAKLRAPVLTGHLRRSIANQVVDEENRSVVSVGSNVDYAGVIELGSVVRNIMAQPYIRPSITENIRQLNSIIQKGMRVK